MKKDWIQQMVENAEKARYIRAVFSPMSERTERTMCTSDKYPYCLDCALGATLECVHYVQFKKPDNLCCNLEPG